MTIKKRMFISNLLMTIMPYVISMITVGAIVYVLNMLSDDEILPTRGGGLRGIHLAENFLQGILLLFLVALLFFAIVITTNRLLTKFVFKKIMQPLDMLSDGVKHISEGNLNHRINYAEQNEFKPICEAFNKMTALVQKNEQNRKELFAGISHDLRSPLTSIKAFTEGLLDGVATTPEAQEEYLRTILQKTDDINSMVSQLFLYSKMDMGNYPINPEVLDIGKELEDFITASHEEYKTKGLAVKIIGTISKVNIHADPLQLRSIFANILDNSAKYKNKGHAIAKITCLSDNNMVKIIFEDDGAGVDEQSLPRLFDAFYRADPSRSSPNQGSGLGLAITLKALERMNGNATAENIKIGGLRIIIEIPVLKGAASS